MPLSCDGCMAACPEKVVVTARQAGSCLPQSVSASVYSAAPSSLHALILLRSGAPASSPYVGCCVEEGGNSSQTDRAIKNAQG